MKKKFIVGLLSMLLIFLLLVLIPVGCDLAKPKMKYRLAVPTTEYFYDYIANQIKPFLENEGYQISIVPAASTFDANRMVADGEADLAMINNHSTTIAMNLGPKSSQLRTIMPLSNRVLYVYTKNVFPDSTTALELFKGKRIGVESLEGETHLTLKRFLKVSQIDDVTFEVFNDSADVNIFWGRLFGPRASEWSKKGWHQFSFRINFIRFITLNDPAVQYFRKPALPGDVNSKITNTLMTEVILVANRNLGENACYLLARTIFQNKQSLMHQDLMYRSITEAFNKETLLFPLHQGTFSYLIREQPTFFERYADTLALALSILAVIYGSVQAIQGQMRRNRKEHIDKYFIEFLEIRSDKTITRELRVKKLDELFQRAVVQLTKEKLEKGDFHILSRLIQQDLTMLRFDS
jgi:TRAP-type uncharacterized transport system substrate-binding protein